MYSDVLVYMYMWASLMAQVVKNPHSLLENWVLSLGQENALEKRMATHSSIWPGEVHGQISLAGYSPQDCEELDTRELLSTHTITFPTYTKLKHV